MSIRVLSLFAGIGAHDRGLELAGCEIVGQVEWDAYCTAVLEKHWPDVPRWSDIRDVTVEDVWRRCGRIDLVTGGVPCQPASVAGKRQGDKDSRWLWPEYLRLVVGIQPQWILAENVPGFLSLRESGQVFADLAAAGYDVWCPVISAGDIGAPHRRERVWVVGRRVAQSAGERWERGGTARRWRPVFADGSELADSIGAGRRERRGAESVAPEQRSAERGRCEVRWPARPGEPQHAWEEARLCIPRSDATESGVCRSATVLAEWMDRTTGLSTVSYDIIGYGSINQRLSGQILCMVRQASCAEEVRDAVGSVDASSATEILRIPVYGEGQDESNAIARRAPKPDAAGTGAGAEVRALRRRGLVGVSPSRQRSLEQRAIERRYAVCFLPYALALGAWKETAPDLATVRRVWRAVKEAPNVSAALVPLQEIWRSAADQKARAGWALLFGACIAERQAARRRDRLKALGNANPWVTPYLIGRWLMWHSNRKG